MNPTNLISKTKQKETLLEKYFQNFTLIFCKKSLLY